jgi:UDP-N-acetylmuramoyl-tripeptide--D-alanyl-D-alanine ligase
VVLADDLRPAFRLVTPVGAAEVRLAVAGRHNVVNALAATAIGLAADVDVAEVAAGLEEGSLSPWRMEVVRLASGAVVVNDAYNANPTSVVAALRALDELPADRRVAVLGPMAELGHHHDDGHREVSDEADRLGIAIIAVGTDDYGVSGVDLDGAVDALGALGPGDAVLVKGSRVAGLERLVELVGEE